MKRVKDSLYELGVRPQKSRGQSFLIDPAAIEEIINFGRPDSADSLVEIGPGLGALTKELSAFPNLTLIEIEGKFCAELEKLYPQAKIINSDVRMVDFSELGSNLVVFGNLPYSFSTDIIFHLVEFPRVIKRAVLMLQKEFAERLAASPGGRTYGVLSISCQLRADVRVGPVISGDSFHPPARVDSRLVELDFLENPRYQIKDLFEFKRVVSAAFFKRRKKIGNSLQASGAFSKPQIDIALEQAEIDPNRLAETLSIEEFVRLVEAF